MKIIKMMMMLLTFTLSLFLITACDMGDKKAETFGEKVDEAIDDTKDAADEAADDTRDAMEKACEKTTDENC